MKNLFEASGRLLVSLCCIYILNKYAYPTLDLWLKIGGILILFIWMTLPLQRKRKGDCLENGRNNKS